MLINSPCMPCRSVHLKLPFSLCLVPTCNLQLSLTDLQLSLTGLTGFPLELTPKFSLKNRNFSTFFTRHCIPNINARAGSSFLEGLAWHLRTLPKVPFPCQSQLTSMWTIPTYLPIRNSTFCVQFQVSTANTCPKINHRLILRSFSKLQIT